MGEKVVAVERKVVDQVDRDDELSFSEREQLGLGLELDRGVGTEVDPTWPIRGETRATQPLSQTLRLRQPPCFLDSEGDRRSRLELKMT